jgi:Holliday junction resolvase RusA-like endonuclease
MRLVARMPGMKKNSEQATCSLRCGDGWYDITLYTAPVPASRPRVTRWGVYYGKTYKAYRAAAKGAIPRCLAEQLTGPLTATIEFVCHKPKTTKRDCPSGDIDNHVKAILDAIVGEKDDPKGYIIDDMQITYLVASKRWVEEGEVPHTKVNIGRI